MRNAFVEVRLELDLNSLIDQPDPTAYIVELARAEADRLCDQNKARLRTDKVPQFDIQKAQHRETGQMVVLVATRWSCEMPDNTLTGPPEQRRR